MFLNKIRARQQRRRMEAFMAEEEFEAPLFGVETYAGPLLNEHGVIDFMNSRDFARAETLTLMIDEGYFGAPILESVRNKPVTTLQARS